MRTDKAGTDAGPWVVRLVLRQLDLRKSFAHVAQSPGGKEAARGE